MRDWSLVFKMIRPWNWTAILVKNSCNQFYKTHLKLKLSPSPMTKSKNYNKIPSRWMIDDGWWQLMTTQSNPNLLWSTCQSQHRQPPRFHQATHTPFIAFVELDQERFEKVWVLGFHQNDQLQKAQRRLGLTAMNGREGNQTPLKIKKNIAIFYYLITGYCVLQSPGIQKSARLSNKICYKKFFFPPYQGKFLLLVK